MNNMNIPDRFWKAGAGALGLLTVFLIVLTIKGFKEIAYVGKSDQTVNTITVDGTGEALATPDIATFSFTVTEQAKTVADAQTAATTKINKAIQAVKDGGVDAKDIQTTSYNINPHYEYSQSSCVNTVSYCPGKQVLTGYEVSQTIAVKIRNLDKAGALFTSIGSLGVQNVNGLNFSVDKPDAVQSQARTDAITKAKAKADELAKELGVTIVRVVSFSENGNYPRPMMYAMDSAIAGKGVSAQAIAPEIPTGEQKVTSNVSITYEIR